MVTVEQLIEGLQKYPKELKVAINHKIAEEQDVVYKLTIRSEDTAPYSRGDTMWNMYGISNSEEILFIESL